jgi:hypothetical protein
LILTHLGDVGSVGLMARKLRVEYPGAVYHLMNRRSQLSVGQLAR